MNFENFKPTPIVKKISRSKSSEKLNEIDKPVEETNETVAEVKPIRQRGRKTKYATDEERLEARKQQQREYRDRKKEELKMLKDKIAEYEALVINQSLKV